MSRNLQRVEDGRSLIFMGTQQKLALFSSTNVGADDIHIWTQSRLGGSLCHPLPSPPQRLARVCNENGPQGSSMAQTMSLPGFIDHSHAWAETAPQGMGGRESWGAFLRSPPHGSDMMIIPPGENLCYRVRWSLVSLGL